MAGTQEKPKGFLRRCIDRRFHEQTRQLFQQVTGLSPTDYWDEGIAGTRWHRNGPSTPTAI